MSLDGNAKPVKSRNIGTSGMASIFSYLNITICVSIGKDLLFLFHLYIYMPLSIISLAIDIFLQYKKILLVIAIS